MFGRIAPRYDLMNRLMTLGMDGSWRRLAAAQAQPAAGESVLDACCGTGDLSLALTKMYPSCHIVGLDFAPEMLARARQKAEAYVLAVTAALRPGQSPRTPLRGWFIRRGYRGLGRTQRG